MNHKAHVIPHRHIGMFVFRPHSGTFCTEGNLTARVTIRRMGLGVQGVRRQRGAKEEAPILPRKKKQGVSYLEPPFQDSASSCHKNRNLFIAL